MFRLISCLALCAVLLGCSSSVDESVTETQSPATAPSPEQTPVPNEAARKPTAENAQPLAEQPSTDSTDSGSVTGTAVDGEGKGVEETEISIYRPNEEDPIAVTTTGDDGRFTLRAVPVGENLVVRAVKPKSRFGVSGKKQPVSVKAGEQTDIGNIELMISLTSD